MLNAVLKMKMLEIESENEQDGELVNDEDTDVCNVKELANLFSTPCNLLVEEQIAKDKYILHIDGTK